MKKLLIPLAVAAGMYGAAPLVLKRRLAPPHRPAPQSPSDLGLAQDQIWMTSRRGTRLHGWLIPAGSRAPAVVVLHGWGGNASLMLPLAPHLHRAGFHALFLDARNHGFSEHDDHSSMPRFAEDLDVAVEFLEQRADVTSVGAIGHSVGGGAAILAASRDVRLAAVVAVSTFAHPTELFVAHTVLGDLPEPIRRLGLKTLERTIGHAFDDIAPINRIGGVRVPLMLVHGTDDDVVPVADLYRLARSAPGAEVVEVPGAGHSDLHAFEPHIGTLVGFLARHL